MSKAAIGTIVKCFVTEHDVVSGKEYKVTNVGEYGTVYVLDDIGEEYVLLEREYSIVSLRESTIHDIRGEAVCVGDTVAYAFAGAAYRHLALFEVQQVNGPLALCRSLKDGAVINLGVFEERAIIIK